MTTIMFCNELRSFNSIKKMQQFKKFKQTKPGTKVWIVSRFANSIKTKPVWSHGHEVLLWAGNIYMPLELTSSLCYSSETTEVRSLLSCPATEQARSAFWSLLNAFGPQWRENLQFSQGVLNPINHKLVWQAKKFGVICETLWTTTPLS